MKTSSDSVELKPGVQFSSSWLKETLYLDEDQAAALGVSQYDGMILFGQLYKLDSEQLMQVARIVFDEDDMVQLLTSGDHSYSLQSYVKELAEPLEIEETITFSEGKTNPERDSLLTALFSANQVGITQLVMEISDKFAKFLGTQPGHESKLQVQRLSRVNKRTGLPMSMRSVIENSSLLPNLLIIDVSGSQGYSLIAGIVDNCIDLAVKYDMHLVIVSHVAEWYVPGTYDRETVMASPCMGGGTRYASMAEIGVASQSWGTVVTVADIDGQGSDITAWQEAGGTVDKVVDISTVAGQSWLSEIVNVQAPKRSKVQQLVVAPDSQRKEREYREAREDFEARALAWGEHEGGFIEWSEPEAATGTCPVCYHQIPECQCW